jgi:hypothetical protein
MSSKQLLTDALTDVFNSLNILGSNNSELVRGFFSRQHRTLQQQFMKVVVIPVLQELANNHLDGRVDARNQRAAALAFKMLDSLKSDELYLPLI